MSRFVTPNEVALHNSIHDCWVIVFDKVVDVTSVIAHAPHELAAPILENAGADVSHWFKKGEDGLPTVKTRIDPVSNAVMPFTPEGIFAHVHAGESLPAGASPVDTPWWRNAKLVVANLTASPRLIRLINTLTGQEHIVEFASEDTVSDMQRKFLVNNAHCTSYTWKSFQDGHFKVLDPKRTLPENGVPDDTKELERLSLDPLHPDNLTTVMLFFNDDLTVA